MGLHRAVCCHQMETEDLRAQLAAEREQNAQMTAVMEEYSAEITKLMESKVTESENAEVNSPQRSDLHTLGLPATMCTITAGAVWPSCPSPRPGSLVALFGALTRPDCSTVALAPSQAAQLKLEKDQVSAVSTHLGKRDPWSPLCLLNHVDCE